LCAEQLPGYARPKFLRVLSDTTADANKTGTFKQQKVLLREQGVDPALVAA